MIHNIMAIFYKNILHTYIYIYYLNILGLFQYWMNIPTVSLGARGANEHQWISGFHPDRGLAGGGDVFFCGAFCGTPGGSP